MKLDRMIAREVIVPAALGFVTYTFLLMMRGLFGLIEQIFVRGLPVRDALAVLLVTMPHVVVLTIPMGYLFGVLLAVGRLSADNEIIALQASGISARRLIRPVVAIAVLLTILNGYLFTVTIPESHRALKDLRLRLFAAARNLGRIQPGVFYEEFPNLLLYVRHVDEETGEWKDVLIYDSSSAGEERLTLAQRGRVVTGGRSLGADGSRTGGSNQPWIVLEDAVTHQFQRARPATYRVNQNRELRFRPQIQGGGVVRYDVAMRERSTRELVEIVRTGEVAGDSAKSPERRTLDLRTAKVELHRRFAVPAASIVFALLALPLGIGSRSGGRGRGFVISVAVVLVYYVLGNNGEVLAMEGTLPVWLGMWLPNISLTVLALALMTRMGRWLGERGSREGPVHRVTRRWQEWRLARQARHAAPGHPRPVHQSTVGVSPEVRRQRRSTRFPALLDRYVVARLLAPLLLVLASTSALYIVIDLTEHVSAMAEHGAPLTVILAYYWNLMPQVLVDVIPFGMLIAVLIVLTTLERQQELTALKGGGVSLFRLVVPVLLVASVGGLAMWLLSENVVPHANREKDRLLDVIEGKEAARSYRVTDRQWLLSKDGGTFYNFLRYDADTKTLVRLTIYRIDEQMRLTFHQYAHRARWQDGAWVADGGWFRQFFPDGTDEFRRITKPLKLQVAEGPEYFGQEYSSPSEMSFGELEGYIHELEESGYQPSQLIVRLHQKLSYPLSAVIMVWLAVPFALNRGGRRVTTMQGVALALGLGIGYSILVTVFGELGEAELLPPVVGAWAPVLLGMLFAINRMTTLRT